MIGTPVRVRAAAVILLSLAMFGCGAGETPPEKQAAAPAPPPVESAERATVEDKIVGGESPVEAASETVVVEEFTQGDRACYLRVKSAQGEGREEMAVMELCERGDLVGRTVRLSYEMGSVAAESCQGDPECAESEMVRLVSDIEVLP